MFAMFLRSIHRQEIGNKNWQGAMDGIAGCPQPERIEPMVELLLAKLLAEDDHMALWKKFLPQLLEVNGLPNSSVDNLQLLRQVAEEDQLGASTFDTLLQGLEAAKKEPMVRVLFAEADGDGQPNGEKLLESIRRANSFLQDRCEKAAKIEDVLMHVKTVASTAEFCQCIEQVADMPLRTEDLELGSLVGDLQALATLLEDKIDSLTKACDLTSLLNRWNEGQVTKEHTQTFSTSDFVKDMATMAAFLRKEGVLKLLRRGPNVEGNKAKLLTDLNSTVPRVFSVSVFF